MRDGWDEGQLRRGTVGKRDGSNKGWLGRRMIGKQVLSDFLNFFQIIIKVLGWTPLMRTISLTLRGSGRERNHLTEKRPVEAERTLMNQPTSRVAYICTMTTAKVSALFLFK